MGDAMRPLPADRGHVWRKLVRTLGAELGLGGIRSVLFEESAVDGG